MQHNADSPDDRLCPRCGGTLRLPLPTDTPARPRWAACTQCSFPLGNGPLVERLAKEEVVSASRTFLGSAPERMTSEKALADVRAAWKGGALQPAYEDDDVVAFLIMNDLYVLNFSEDDAAARVRARLNLSGG